MRAKLFPRKTIRFLQGIWLISQADTGLNLIRKDSVLDTEKDLTVKVENSRAVYSFTPKETGRYELSTSTFVEGVLKDGDGKEIEKQNRHERSMYVSLAEDTTYYMYMTVQSSLCTQIQVSAEKLALPVEITVSLKKTSYTAELMMYRSIIQMTVF